MARPKKELDWPQIEKLCQIMCTHEEIAKIMECCVETLDNACKRDNKLSFSEYYAQKASHGKVSLRRKQWQMALNGDRVMLIWLGKQHLDQTEKVSQTVEANLKTEDKKDERLNQVLALLQSEFKK
jgi:hypothetical protein